MEKIMFPAIAVDDSSCRAVSKVYSLKYVLSSIQPPIRKRVRKVTTEAGVAIQATPFLHL